MDILHLEEHLMPSHLSPHAALSVFALGCYFSDDGPAPVFSRARTSSPNHSLPSSPLPLSSSEPGFSKESSTLACFVLLLVSPSNHYHQDTPHLLTSTSPAKPPLTSDLMSVADAWTSSVKFIWFPSAMILLRSLAIPSSFSCSFRLVFLFSPHRSSCFPQGPALAFSALFTRHPLEITYPSWVQQLPRAVL